MLLLGRKTAKEKVVTFLLDLAQRLRGTDRVELKMQRSDIVDRAMLKVLRRLSLLMTLLPACAAAQDVEQGREIARRWCSACHVVERTATQAPANGLPTFPAIAARPDLSVDRLRAAINPQHSRMPDLALSKRQQDDLIAYIFSLRP